MCHLVLTSFSRLSGHDKVFCLGKFLSDYKWEVIDIWYGSWSRVVHVCLLYGICRCPWPPFHGWVDMLCVYDQEDFSATIHGRLMSHQWSNDSLQVYVPVRHVSHSLDLGYVAGLLLLCSVYAAKAYWTFALFHFSWNKIKNNKTIIVVKDLLPPSREGRGATF